MTGVVFGDPSLPMSSIDPALESCVAALTPRSLATLPGPHLQERLDTKFLVPVGALSTLLKRAAPSYHALEIGDRRFLPYTTRYFDSADLRLFRDHLVRRPHRWKVRSRGYRHTGEWFFEIKERKPSGVTRKVRSAIVPPDSHDLPSCAGALIPSALHDETLTWVLDIDYRRLTLIAPDLDERVTVDAGLRWTAQSRSAAIADTAVVELKQGHRFDSPMRRALREAGIRPRSISKYCLGVVATRPDIRSGRFRTQWRALSTTDSHSLSIEST